MKYFFQIDKIVILKLTHKIFKNIIKNWYYKLMTHDFSYYFVIKAMGQVVARYFNRVFNWVSRIKFH